MTVPESEIVVIDASVLVDLLAGTDRAPAARERLRGTVLHAPAHMDAEVLSALGRMHRADVLTATEVDAGLSRLAAIPLTRHPLSDLLSGAWARRADIRLLDALYVELAARLNVPLLTTDLRLSRVSSFAEAV